MSRLKTRPPQESGRNQLQRWIDRHRMTQDDAGRRIGISRVKLNQYLNGVRRPGLEVAIRIEDATGIDARSWLVGAADSELLAKP